jgi:hypothetical protein
MKQIKKNTITINEILATLRKNSQEASTKYKAELKGVFGSYVKDMAGAGSDIDVLVEFADTANLLDLVGLSCYLEEKLNCPVDVVPESSLREEIKSSILKETLYL